MPYTLELYRWRYRDELTGKVRVTTWLATEADIRQQLGERVIEAVPDSREVRYVDPDQPRAGDALAPQWRRR